MLILIVGAMTLELMVIMGLINSFMEFKNGLMSPDQNKKSFSSKKKQHLVAIDPDINELFKCNCII